MSASKYIKRTVSLDGSPITEQIPASFFNGERDGHTFIIDAIRDGEPFPFNGQGSVVGTFLNANDETVTFYGGLLNGAAYITLDNGCYHVNGRFTFTISVGNVVVYECQSMIKRRSSSTYYDPSHVIPTIEELLNEIAAMRAATAEANAAATAAENVDADLEYGNNSVTISVTGRDGTVKTQTINVTTDDASTDLIYDERLLNNGQYVVTATDMESGTWSFSDKRSNTKRLRNHNLIPVSAGMQIAYSNPTLKVVFSVLPNKTSGSYSQLGSWIAPGGSGVVNITKDGYLVFLCESADNSDIAVADYDCEVEIRTVLDSAAQPLTGAELSALTTIFDMKPGRYFSATGARLKQLIDHSTNSNVPEGNSAPDGISDSGMYLVRSYTYAVDYGYYEIVTPTGKWHYVGTTAILHPNVINWYDISHEDVMEEIKKSQPLSTSELNALDTIFDMQPGRYFSTTGARLKQLLDHNINANVPEGNAAPDGISDSGMYLVRSFVYGTPYSNSYAMYDVVRANGGQHYVGTTAILHPNSITWSEDLMEDKSKKNTEYENATMPQFYGDSFAWILRRYFTAEGTLSFNNNSATSELIPVEPGTKIINKTPATGINGAESYLYIGVYKNGAFVRREPKFLFDEVYIVGDDCDHIRFGYGTLSAQSGNNIITAEQLAKYFSVKILTKAKQEVSFVDVEKPLYLALGASTSWGAVHHPDGTGITQTKYQYPIMAGNDLGLETINLAVGSAGMIARTTYDRFADTTKVNESAFNGGNNNYMDIVYANDDLFSRASLITLQLAHGNDMGKGLPLGEIDDYYPYDEAGYHIYGEDSVAAMIAKGATYFGCLNWIIKWIGEHYPKAQFVIIDFHMYINSRRTIEQTPNTDEDAGTTGNPPYKLVFNNPYTGSNGEKQLHDKLKQLCDTIKIPFIDLFDDGVPFNYYNANTKDPVTGEYILFSTVRNEDTGELEFNVHPSDAGYKLIGRYIAARIAGLFRW